MIRRRCFTCRINQLQYLWHLFKEFIKTENSQCPSAKYKSKKLHIPGRLNKIYSRKRETLLVGSSVGLSVVTDVTRVVSAVFVVELPVDDVELPVDDVVDADVDDEVDADVEDDVVLRVVVGTSVVE